MTHLTKILFIAAASVVFSGTAFANTAFLPPSNETADVLVVIAESDIKEAQTAFEAPLKLNVSTLEVDVETNDIIGEELEFSDELDTDYHLTDEAFIGIADIHEDAPITGEKGGFPEGRHIDPYTTVAGGGIKTKF